MQSVHPALSTELPSISKIKLEPLIVPEPSIVEPPTNPSRKEELKKEKKLTEEERLELWKRLLEILITRYSY
jgi:hypothetical protein